MGNINQTINDIAGLGVGSRPVAHLVNADNVDARLYWDNTNSVWVAATSDVWADSDVTIESEPETYSSTTYDLAFTGVTGSVDRAEIHVRSFSGETRSRSLRIVDGEEVLDSTAREIINGAGSNPNTDPTTLAYWQWECENVAAKLSIAAASKDYKVDGQEFKNSTYYKQLKDHLELCFEMVGLLGGTAVDYAIGEPVAIEPPWPASSPPSFYIDP